MYTHYRRTHTQRCHGNATAKQSALLASPARDSARKPRTPSIVHPPGAAGARVRAMSSMTRRICHHTVGSVPFGRSSFHDPCTATRLPRLSICLLDPYLSDGGVGGRHGLSFGVLPSCFIKSGTHCLHPSTPPPEIQRRNHILPILVLVRKKYLKRSQKSATRYRDRFPSKGRVDKKTTKLTSLVL